MSTRYYQYHIRNCRISFWPISTSTSIFCKFLKVNTISSQTDKDADSEHKLSVPFTPICMHGLTFETCPNGVQIMVVLLHHRIASYPSITRFSTWRIQWCVVWPISDFTVYMKKKIPKNLGFGPTRCYSVRSLLVITTKQKRTEKPKEFKIRRNDN
jgi:hypothetical protein